MEWVKENWASILFFLSLLDVVVGALPQSWVKYTGVTLDIAKKLREFDIKGHGFSRGR